MVYTLYFALLILGAIVARGRSGSSQYLMIIMIALLIIIGFRDISVGTDTLSYTKDFAYFAQMSFSEIWDYAMESKEPLYVLVSWLPSIFSSNYTLYLFTWALFPIFSLYNVFKEELNDSKDILVAMIVFFLLGLFAFYVAGIRQTAALSIVFWGAKFLRRFSWKGLFRLLLDKNIYAFFLMITVAYMIHNSAILFILAIPCLFFKVRWWYLLGILGLFFLGSYVKIDQIVLLSELFFDDRFASYGTVYESSQNTSALIMQLILFSICFLVRGKLVDRDSNNNFFFNMMFIGLVLQSLSGMLAEMSRISFYFIMFAMILVPRAFEEYPRRIQHLAYVGFMIVGIFYLFFLTGSNLPRYHSIF